MIILTRSQVHAMRQSAAGGAIQPLRSHLTLPGGSGRMALMPGRLAEPRCFGVEIVSKFDRARGDGHGTHVGIAARDLAAAALLHDRAARREDLTRIAIFD